MKKLKKEADYIVCLSHIGFDIDKAIAKEIDGIDLILSGYSVRKDDKPLKINNTLIIQTDYDAKYAGIITIIFEDNKYNDYYFQNVALDKKYPEDPDVMERYIKLNRRSYPKFLQD